MRASGEVCESPSHAVPRPGVPPAALSGLLHAAPRQWIGIKNRGDCPVKTLPVRNRHLFQQHPILSDRFEQFRRQAQAFEKCAICIRVWQDTIIALT
jgi:hypothetical protein